jgi:5-methylcytosine-specific restriction endonuclease McrA
MTDTCLDRLRALRTEFGTSEFDRAIRTLMRERVNPDREKRKPVRWAAIKRAYIRQGGKCSVCGLDMRLLRGEVEGDHRDPNRVDFNHESNIAVSHAKCNRSKGSLSIPEQAKRYGQTMAERLGDDL